MSLQAAYRQFLAAPNSSALSPNASLHYITTTTSFNGPTDIIKHLGSLRNQVKKKKEELLHVVEGQNAIAVESEITLEFVSSGAVYLPALDDNFVADHTVCLPIVSHSALGRHPPSPQSHSHPGALAQLANLGEFLAPYHSLRQRRQNFPDSAKLGSGRASETARRYWQDWSQLAYSRQQGSTEVDRDFGPGLRRRSRSAARQL